MAERGRPCSIAAALAVVGEKWALLVVRELMFGNHRYSDIARNTAAPRDVLAARLRSLEAAGVIERRRYLEHPPRHTYHLTDAGRDLAGVVHALRAWGDRWAGDPAPATFDHDDHPFEVAVVCRQCGQDVVPHRLHMHVHSPGWDVRGPVAPAARGTACVSD